MGAVDPEPGAITFTESWSKVMTKFGVITGPVALALGLGLAAYAVSFRVGWGLAGASSWY